MPTNKRRRSRKGKITTRTLLLAVLCSVALPTISAQAQGAGTLPVQLVSEQSIGEGVIQQTYNKQIGGKKSWVYVTKVDLNNQYVQVKPIFGKDGTFAAKQSVQALAKEQGAIAAINADFFTLQKRTPFGMTVDNGEIISSMARVSAWSSLAIFQDQTVTIENFTYKGRVLAPNGESYPIQGVNKEEYLATGIQSHKDQINLYTPRFGPISFGSKPGMKDYTEVVVDQGVVKDIRVNQPQGASIPANGHVLWGHGSGARFLSQLKVGDTAPITSTHAGASGREDILAAMGGHLLLVDNGKALNPYDRHIAGKVSRSAVGVSNGGKTLHLVAVEGPGNSRGMDLGEVALLMKELGVDRAANLDGGGSTTMVARKLADTELSLMNTPQYKSQRQVPTAIGVFNNAPAGAFKDFKLEGPSQVIKGTEASFQLKGWDQHLHPLAINASEATWDGPGTFSGNKMLALTSGKHQVTATFQGVQHKRDVEVIGASGVAKLIAEPATLVVDKNATATFKVKVQTKDGKVLNMPAQAIDSSVVAELGTVEGYQLTAGAEVKKGVIHIDYDGVKLDIPLQVGQVEQKPKGPFTDVEAGAWYEKPVLELHREGIISGMTKDTFEPQTALTRAQFVTLLDQWLGWSTDTDQPLDFNDTIPEYAQPAIKAAVSKKIAQGFPGKLFKPNEPLTRAQMAVMLYNALLDRGDSFDTNATSGFIDEKEIPEWAEEAVQVMAAQGYIKGMDDAFQPQGQATRAHAAALIYQIKSGQ